MFIQIKCNLAKRKASSDNTQLVPVVHHTLEVGAGRVVGLLGRCVLLVEEGQVIIRMFRALGRVGQRHGQRMIAPALPVGSDVSPNGLVDHSGRKATARDLLERAVRRRRSILELLDAVDQVHDVVVALLEGPVGRLEIRIRHA